MKSYWNRILSMVIFGVFLGPAIATATQIDLSSWSSPDSNGNWQVASDNYSVTQTSNGNPTFFLSDSDYSNTVFNGKFEVQTTYDDDFIGFAFGYKGKDDYLLFDWKQNQQTSYGTAHEGYTLSKIHDDGDGTLEVNFWDHSGEDITILATDYGSDKGWADKTEYDFTLQYLSNRIVISIDNNTIFDVAGSFEQGKFGFYNYSQSNVKYQGFDQTAAPVPEPATILLFGTGLLGVACFKLGRKKT